MKLYEQLLDDLSQRIEQGYYPVGTKLPSIRSLSGERAVSISTVQEAYQRLEERGMVEVRPKSGYYVQGRSTAPPLPEVSRPAQRPLEVSHWDQVYHLLNSNKGEGHIALGTAMPEIDTPTLKPLKKGLIDAAKLDGAAFLNYCDVKGSEKLRQQIARLALDSGCQLHPDEIIVTSGCQEALVCSLRAVTNPGDVVAVDSPSFYGSTQAIKALGLKALEIPTHPETGISLEALELALEQWPVKAIQVTPTCNNPLGYTMPEERRKALLRLAQQYDLPIIEDDIYGDLFYKSPRPKTIKSFDDEGRVLLCSSFSKTIAYGLRLGWVAPGQCTERVLHKKFVSTVSNPPVQQEAVAEFIAQGSYERHIRKLRMQYQHSRDVMIDLVEELFPPGTRISYPKGGYLLWVELPIEVDTVKLNKRLEASNISIAPGVIFSASGKYRNCMRLNFAKKLDETMRQALRQVAAEAQLLIEEA
ncbi:MULTISPECIES: PLP-dependent aminotransferase family protein [unclassified Neptuniibacter]|uniref:aminotransferase-like domain-containing protein n=1 Tax=unclassified Neptuniibacter TaxID=2630693 RepID=UPI000C3545A5|nr:MULTISPECIES: PLP-dependent aminotransferase family protein [unclassified Neptuniibacter]MAY43175.1 GntR family transcriptional regulator [Oceanospirillaceae bacterium]|tara:strand:+ start:3415 stop:4833 length:1419 start_codon:yes stop_codon:yes gene_type:complete